MGSLARVGEGGDGFGGGAPKKFGRVLVGGGGEWGRGRAEKAGIPFGGTLFRGGVPGHLKLFFKGRGEWDVRPLPQRRFFWTLFFVVVFL